MKSFNELLESYKNEKKVPYSELLLTSEWYLKREEIIRRDNNICTSCNKTSTMPHYDSKTRKTYHLWFDVKDVLKRTPIGEEIIDEEVNITGSINPYVLQVHHHYYVLTSLPWEYPNEALITLCNWCHWQFHERNQVPVYKDSRQLELLDLTPCSRCNGTGSFPEYNHVYNGICFSCDGAKYEELIKSKN